MKKIRFSIIIAYYHNNTIMTCLKHISKELKGYKGEYEVMLVDDSSKYPLTKKVKSFLKENKMSYFKRETNGGVSKVRNTAIDLTKGEILIFLDADCYLKKGYIQQVIGIFNKFQNAGMVFGKRMPYNAKPFKRFRELKYRYKSGKFQEKDIREFTLKDKDFYLVSGQNMVIKRKILNEVGYFVPNTGCEDIEMQYMIMRRGYSTVYNPNMIVYHNHPHKFWHYVKKAFRYGRGFQKFKDRQSIDLVKNKYYQVYMGEGKIFERFESLKGKTIKYKLEVLTMEIFDYFANKISRFIEKILGKGKMFGAYGVIYTIKDKELKFIVAKYDDGYGLIGGRIEKGEDLNSAFLRELNEEIGVDETKVKKLFLTKERHIFEGKRGIEKHYFFSVKLDNNCKLEHKDVEPAWLSESEMRHFTKWENTQNIVNRIIEGVRKNENM